MIIVVFDRKRFGSLGRNLGSDRRLLSVFSKNCVPGPLISLLTCKDSFVAASLPRHLARRSGSDSQMRGSLPPPSTLTKSLPRPRIPTPLIATTRQPLCLASRIIPLRPTLLLPIPRTRPPRRSFTKPGATLSSVGLQSCRGPGGRPRDGLHRGLQLSQDLLQTSLVCNQCSLVLQTKKSSATKSLAKLGDPWSIWLARPPSANLRR